MIKKIHQLSKTSELKDFEKESQKRLIEFNEGYEYKLWTDEDLKILFKENNEELYNLWDKMRGVQRADLGRYLILYLEGGFYCDTDFYLNSKLDDLGILDKTYFAPSTPDFIFFEPGFTNYFMYSPGGDKIFLDIILESINRIKNTSDYNQPVYISYTTGKILINKIAKEKKINFNIFSRNKIIDMNCDCTKIDDYIGYHNGGTSRKNKKDSWLNSYVSGVIEVECSLRKNLGVKGNICQVPLLFIIAVILTLVLIFYSFRKMNRVKRVNKEKKVRFKK